ncbi:MAG: AAA family ATPase [Sulfurimonas sp.]|jgi:AAA15 family ATPase/GTPase
MQVIKEIKIAYFRSFSKQVHIKNINDLNILSGKNDSGKSNILKALNLFFTESKVDFYNDFNFNSDFSKHRVNESKSQKQRQLLSISILFNKVHFSSKVLPSEFWVEKMWNRDGQFHDRKTKTKKGAILNYTRKGDEKESDAQVKSSTTSFLNKIHFLYIPAIKDFRFFDYLKQEYQQSLGIQISKLSTALNSSENKTLQDWMTQLTAGDITNLLSQKIDNEAERMMGHFLRNTQEINTSNFAIPDLDFSKVLEVVTENEIPLTSRGDGIQAKFIPQILNEISRNKKADIVVWAFEEPENSYEYANAQLLAEKFKDEYSKDKQIFLTSHAFNFISLEGKNVSLYRVWREDFEQGTQIKYIENNGSLLENIDSEILKEEIGVIRLNRELEKLFNIKMQEMRQIAKLKMELDQKIFEIQKPILYVEDKYDQIYKIAWLKINDIEVTEENFERLFHDQSPFQILKAEGASGLEGFLRASNIDYWRDKKVIGLFDFDITGVEKFKNIKSAWKVSPLGILKEGNWIQRFEGVNFYCLLIPIPDRLSTLASLDFPSFIEIEHLLPEDFLKTSSFAVEKFTTGNTKYLEVHSEKKNILWKKLFELPQDNFLDFVPLYKKIKELFELV